MHMEHIIKSQCFEGGILNENSFLPDFFVKLKNFGHTNPKKNIDFFYAASGLENGLENRTGFSHFLPDFQS